DAQQVSCLRRRVYVPLQQVWKATDHVRYPAMAPTLDHEIAVSSGARDLNEATAQIRASMPCLWRLGRSDACARPRCLLFAVRDHSQVCFDGQSNQEQTGCESLRIERCRHASRILQRCDPALTPPTGTSTHAAWA